MKKIIVSASAVICLVAAVSIFANPAFAALTFSDTGVASSGVIGLDGAGAVSIGTANATSIAIGKSGVTSTVNGTLTVAEVANLNGNTTIGNAATDALTVTSEIRGGSPLSFEGNTNDNIYTIFAITDPTGASKTITFPNASGTVAVSATGPITLSADGDIGCATCVTSTPTVTLQNVYDNGQNITTSGGHDIAFTLASGNLTASGAGSVSLTPSGAITFTAGAASTWSTSAGALTLDSAAALNLGTTNATSIAIGKSGITTAINGNSNFDANTLFVDSTNHRVGIGTAGPSERLAVNGGLGVINGYINVVTITPPAPPTAALVATGTGNVTNGLHSYRVSFVTNEGETNLSDATNSVTVDASNKQVRLTGIPVGPANVTARNIYRTLANPPGGRTSYYFLATVAGNSTTEYVDNSADGSLGTVSFSELSNTTSGRLFVNGIGSGYLGDGASTAFGYQALAEIVNGGGGNSAFGNRALYSNTGGIFNSAFGYAALAENLTGNWNVAVGDSALVNNTTGVGNVALGWQALSSNTTNKQSTAIGYGALISSTADYNTAVGSSAMYLTTTGGENTAIGTNALYANTDGGGFVAVGFNAISSLTTGGGVTAVGYQAGYSATSGTNNVFLGYQAGYTGNGSGNVFLGKGAGYYETGSSKLFIDNATRASEADARSNALIYGVFAASPVDQILALNANVGIGTSPSLGKLQVAGNAYFGAGAGQHVDLESIGSPHYGSAVYLTSDWGDGQQSVRLLSTGNLGGSGIGTTQKPNLAIQYSTNAGAYNTEPSGLTYATALTVDGSSGNVGIGTTSPGYKLDVNGAARVSGRLLESLGVAVASANDLALGADGNSFHISGNTTINAITTVNWIAGSHITLIFDSNPTVKHGTAGGAGTAQILLSGGVDFTASANATLTLLYDGTYWYEISRSIDHS